eukprot:NODE_201_length_13147_cov_1.076104.p2 type:complete len:698 gc:universal NODE_201_length_13147_cov_1.076104:1945-4038(+)
MKSRDTLLKIQRKWWEPTEAGEFGNIKEAEQLYKEEVYKFEKLNNAGKTDEKYFKHIVKDGTFNDKITLFSHAIQESPLHNLQKFQDLLSMAGKKNRDQVNRSLEALVTIFTAQGDYSILPKRNLRVYRACLDIKPTTGQIIQAYFEDKLREIFFAMLQIIEEWLKDNVQNSKLRMLSFLYSLGVYTFEHSENIIRLVANKLGDPDKKVASKAGYVLITISNEKSALKWSVIRNLKSQISKTDNINCKSVSLNHLSQIKFSLKDDTKLYSDVITIYMEIMDEVMGINPNVISFDVKEKDKKKLRVPDEGPEFKVIHYSLTGLKRVLPYIESTMEKIDDISKDLKKYEKLLFLINQHSPSTLTCFQTLGVLVQFGRLMPEIKQKLKKALIDITIDAKIFNTKYLSLYLEVLESYLNDAPSDLVLEFVRALLSISIHFVDSNAKIQVLEFVIDMFKKDLTFFKRTIPPPKASVPNREDIEKLNEDSLQLHLTVNDEQEILSDVLLFEITALIKDYDPSMAIKIKELLSLNKRSIRETTKKTEFVKSAPIMFLDIFTNRKQKKRNDKGHNELQKTLMSKKPSEIRVDELYLYEFFKDKKPKLAKSNDEDVDGESILSAEIELPSDLDDKDLTFSSSDSEVSNDEIIDHDMDVDPFERLEESLGDDNKKKKRKLPLFMTPEAIEEIIHKKKNVKRLDVTKF